MSAVYPFTRRSPRWEVAFDPGATFSDAPSYSNYTERCIIPATQISKSGSSARIRFKSSTGLAQYTKVYIGHAALSGDVIDFDGNQKQVFVGSASLVNVPIGTQWSDIIPLEVDEARPLIISALISGTYGNLPKGDIAVGECYCAYGDLAATTNVSIDVVGGFTLDAYQQAIIDQIEVLR